MCGSNSRCGSNPLCSSHNKCCVNTMCDSDPTPKAKGFESGTADSRDSVHSGADAVLVGEFAQGKLCAEGGGEGVHAYLHVVGTDVEVGRHVLDELQHLVEVALSNTARLVQQEHDVSLATATCTKQQTHDA